MNLWSSCISLIFTMSHWSSRITVCFSPQGAAVRAPGVQPTLWELGLPISVFSLATYARFTLLRSEPVFWCTVIWTWVYCAGIWICILLCCDINWCWDKNCVLLSGIWNLRSAVLGYEPVFYCDWTWTFVQLDWDMNLWSTGLGYEPMFYRVDISKLRESVQRSCGPGAPPVTVNQLHSSTFLN
jgi:hypothetical protein